MPNNESENPFDPDNPLFGVYEHGDSNIRELLRTKFVAVEEPAVEDFVGPPPMPSLAGFPPPQAALPVSPQNDRYAPAAWAAPKEEDFTVPSGGIVRLRRVDILDLLGDGLLNKLDFMTGIVSEHTENANSPTGKADLTKTVGKELFGDKERQDNFSEVMAKVVMRVVVRPQLWAAPPEGEDRVVGCFYVDQVPFQDKTAIFNWAVTGKNQAGLAQFREEAGESVGTVEPREDVPDTTVELPGSS